MADRLIYTPYFLDASFPGMEAFAKRGWIRNRPTLVESPQMANLATVNRALADEIAATLAADERPVSFAGDCVAAIGMVAGLQRGGLHPTLIWFDAHGDLNTWETTPSQFLGGMPLAMMLGHGEQTILDVLNMQALNPENVILTDARDLDPGEKALLEKEPVVHLPNATDLLTHPLPDGPLYVHFDVDIIDPTDAPALAYPAPGGPSVDDLRAVFAHLAATDRMVGVSVSAWKFDADGEEKTRDAVMSLLDTLLGVEGEAD